MGTHWMIFLTISNLVSPAQFPLRRTSEGADWSAPSERKIFPFSAAQAGPSSRGICWLARATCETGCLLIGGSSIRRVANALGDPCFRRSRDRFVAQLFFGSHPVLDIFSVFAAALKIQVMSPASDLFSRWFSESNHCNLLGCHDGVGAPTDLRMSDVDYLPFAETVIFICFGLDSSRFVRCKVKTPLR